MSAGAERRPRGTPAPSWRGYARWTLRGALAAVLVVGAAAVWDRVRGAEEMQLRRLLVEGRFERVAPAEVFGAARAELGADFLTVDLGAVRAAVEGLPWVASVSVRREWPGTLRISFVEEVPVATWGGRGLLNAAGAEFAPIGAETERYAALPALAGPDGSTAEVLAAYQEMQRAVASAGLTLSRVEQSERHAWTVWSSDGTQVRLGRRDALPRLGRYASVAAPLVAPQAAHVAYVDMRYANGFALGWRTQQAAAPGPKRARTPSERTDV